MEHLLSLVDFSPIGQRVLDRDGRVQLVNSATAGMLGWSANLTLAVEPAFADLVFAATFAELSRRAWLGEPQRTVEVSLVDGWQTRVLSTSLVAHATRSGVIPISFIRSVSARRNLCGRYQRSAANRLARHRAIR